MNDTCQLCGYNGHKTIYKKYLPESFNLRTCTNCRFTVIHPLPFDYNLVKGEGGGIEYDNKRDFGIKILADYSLKRISGKFKNTNFHAPGKILEIGSGIGTCLKYLNEKGFTTTGIEVNRSQAMYGRDKFSVDIKDKTIENCGFEDNSFDMIISFHTFEHIVELPLYFKECYRVLRTGGVISIDVPNYRFADSFYEKKMKMDRIVGTYHINYFTRKTLRKFLENADFKNIHFEPGLWGFPIIQKLKGKIDLNSSALWKLLRIFVYTTNFIGIRRNINVIAMK